MIWQYQHQLWYQYHCYYWSKRRGSIPNNVKRALTHCILVTSWVNFDSGNILVSDPTKLLATLMLYWINLSQSLSFSVSVWWWIIITEALWHTSEDNLTKCWRSLSLTWFWKLLIQYYNQYLEGFSFNVSCCAIQANKKVRKILFLKINCR